MPSAPSPSHHHFYRWQIGVYPQIIHLHGIFSTNHPFGGSLIFRKPLYEDNHKNGWWADENATPIGWYSQFNSFNLLTVDQFSTLGCPKALLTSGLLRSYREVSWNRGAPKSSILIGCSLWKPFWGTPNLGNPHNSITISSFFQALPHGPHRMAALHPPRTARARVARQVNQAPGRHQANLRTQGAERKAGKITKKYGKTWDIWKHMGNIWENWWEALGCSCWFLGLMMWTWSIFSGKLDVNDDSDSEISYKCCTSGLWCWLYQWSWYLTVGKSVVQGDFDARSGTTALPTCCLILGNN